MADRQISPAESYYLGQIFTIGMCGALGAVAVLIWARGQLTLILNQSFHVYVLLGGVTLLVLVALRSLTLWLAPESGRGHDYPQVSDAEPGAAPRPHINLLAGLDASSADCEHTPNYLSCGTDPTPPTEPVPDYSWAPWRYVFLMLPVVLFLLRMPNDAFSAKFDPRMFEGEALGGSDGQVRGRVANLTFSQLETAANTKEGREYYENKLGTLVGQFVASQDETRFQLTRFKINCCAADAIPINAIIQIDPSTSERLDGRKYQGKWVEVTGRIQFRYLRHMNQYVSALVVTPTPEQPLDQLVKRIAQPPNPYVN
jgi:hypothetical protein